MAPTPSPAPIAGGPSSSPVEIELTDAPSWLLEAIRSAPPKPYQPRLAHSDGDRSPADWCRWYLDFWPNHDLGYWEG